MDRLQPFCNSKLVTSSSRKTTRNLEMLTKQVREVNRVGEGEGGVREGDKEVKEDHICIINKTG